ncbi:MAG: DUF559 domain-containing protein [Sulfuricellaceae bacterium]|nr:DUF559 domain-containing protein [Sulfuricellaceae bacterium]
MSFDQSHMTPETFIAHWANNPLTERAGAQQHFNDLCELLGVDKPRDPENYCFERGAKKSGGGDGWADVWKRGHFGWENKKPGRDLNAALKQLTDYALQLDSPPLLVVCDRERIIIHTAFTGYPDEAREIRIAELTDPGKLQLLRWVFTEPEKLRPEKSTAAITAEAAGQFSSLAKAMRTRGLDGQRVAHFLVQCLFCMFAEDEALLPGNVFTEILKNAGTDTDRAARRIAKIFTAMQQKSGGEYGDHDIAWFNGGLFSAIDVPELAKSDLDILHRAAADMDWRGIDPTIFGTLFERGLDPAARAPLGAHYTDTATIGKLITPLITEPLLAEWESVKVVIAEGKGKKPRAAWQGFLLRLNQFRVLDPACGSGNFLYLALKALRDVEKQVSLEAQELGLPAEIAMQTGPHNILGIEINEFAAELARVTVWIGDIQWCRRNGLEISRNPILKSLEGIEHRDALITHSLSPRGRAGEGEISADAGKISEAEWPVCDVIVGNPPFLGGSKKRGELGDACFEALAQTFPKDRVPPGADLVCYWFDKARNHIEQGKAKAAGLVATNSIRGGANQQVLTRICDSGRIFNAWSDEAWINEGAAVRVSLVCFDASSPSPSGGGVGEGVSSGKKEITPNPPLPEKTKEFARTLRKSSTDVENLLWQLLRRNQLLGYGFRRQHPLGPYFLDFYCHQAKLAVELDGGQHAESGQQAHDERRSAYLAAQGVTVLRFWNNEVLENTEGVLQTVFDWLHGFSVSSSPELTPSPTPPPEGEGLEAMLDGKSVALIHADLTAGDGLNLTQAKPIRENSGVSFQGSQKIGAFDIDGELARQWLKLPNPNGKPNSDVIKPSWNGMDVTRRPRDGWIIDFGTAMSEADAALYEAPFDYVIQHVKPERKSNSDKIVRVNWWRHGRPRPEMRATLTGLTRYMALSSVTKHICWRWLDGNILPDKALIVIARSDDTTFGILHSRFHELWSLRMGTSLEDRPRYTPTTTFETFPFPAGLTPSSPSPLGGGVGEGVSLGEEESCAAENIAQAAKALNQLRETWLNPPEWVDWVRTPEEEKASYPLRPVPKHHPLPNPPPEGEGAIAKGDLTYASELKKRTLTNLYNARPAWLDNAHKTLDAAVALAYGWDDYTPEMSDEEILRRLLALNLAR